MAAVSAHAAASPFPNWNLFFAREVEPDLDFEEDLDDLEDSSPGSYSPQGPRKKSGGPMVMWVLLALVAAGGGYWAWDPDGAMELVAPLLGESQAPPMVVQPPPKTPAQVPPIPGGQMLPSSAAPTVTPASQAAAAFPSPQFEEGQQVSVILDPAAPGGSLSLSADPAGTRPGPTVPPGAVLVVLDGNLQNNTWVYSVRTRDGARGWIAEKRLVGKP